MKSVLKTFRVLEYLFLQEGRCVTPSEIAEQVQINISGAIRILNDLVKLGYLEQRSRRDGYLPGPMIAALACRNNCYRKLENAVRAELPPIANLTDSPVTFTVLNGESRVILGYACPWRGWVPWSHFRCTTDDIRSVATTELLLLAGGYPLPDVKLPEPDIEKVRRSGRIEFEQSEDGHPFIIMGVLVDAPNCPPAALGLKIDKSGPVAEARQASASAAKSIVKALSPVWQPY